MIETCQIKDAPDAPTCTEPRFTTVTVAYTFGAPDSGSYVFDFDMCEAHSLAMKHRVVEDLSAHLKRKA